MYKSLMVYWK